MSFGKVGPDGQRPQRPAATATAKGGVDAGFITLVVSVVVLAASLAVLVPAAFGWMQGAFKGAPVIRTIPEIVASGDRNAIKIALATEALPDKDGQAFLAALKQHFPKDHDALMGALADAAIKGGDRKELAIQVNEWMVPFAMTNAAAIGRSGAAGFDRTIDIADEMFAFMRSDLGNGRCTADAFEGIGQRIAQNPQSLTDLVDYGTAGYRLNMHAGQALVEVAALGRNAPPVQTQMTKDDERAVSMLSLSMLADSQVQGLMRAIGMPEHMRRQELSRIDVCTLASSVLARLKTLPPQTKARFTAVALEAMRAQGPGMMRQMSMR